MPYILIKLIHVLAAIVALGSNVTYVLWTRRAAHDRDRLTFAIEGIRWIDRRLGLPAYLVAFASGLVMAFSGPFRLGAPGMGWLTVAVVIYLATAVIGIVYFRPASRRQLAEARRDPDSPEYASAERRTAILTAITTSAVVAIVVLMVMKPF